MRNERKKKFQIRCGNIFDFQVRKTPWKLGEKERETRWRLCIKSYEYPVDVS